MICLITFKRQTFYVLITTAQTVGAPGAGWREEKDEYCLVRSPGCCGAIDETLQSAQGNQRQNIQTQTTPPPPFLSPHLPPIVLTSHSYLTRNPIASICNSNENQTPAPVNLDPSLAYRRRGNLERRTAEERPRKEKWAKEKLGWETASEERILHYWKIRS